MNFSVCGFPLWRASTPSWPPLTRSLQTGQAKILRSDKLWLTSVEKNRTKVQVWGSKQKEDMTTPLHFPLLYCFQRKPQQTCWCLNTHERHGNLSNWWKCCLDSPSFVLLLLLSALLSILDRTSLLAHWRRLVDKRRQQQDWFQWCKIDNPLHWSHPPDSHGLSHTKHATQTYRTLQPRVHPSAAYFTTNYSTC